MRLKVGDYIKSKYVSGNIYIWKIVDISNPPNKYKMLVLKREIINPLTCSSGKEGECIHIGILGEFTKKISKDEAMVECL